MADQIFLIAPDIADATALTARLADVLSVSPVSVLLLPVGDRSDVDYAALVKSVAPAAQAKGVAVLLEDRFDLVAALGADGVHMNTGMKAIGEAISALKPDLIVGCGNIGSRHDAMLRGELDIDYLLFGDRPGSDAQMADWWAETFEVPSVYLANDIDDPAIKSARSEFIALGADMWNAIENLASTDEVSA